MVVEKLHSHFTVFLPTQSGETSNPIQPRPVSRNIAWSPAAPRIPSRVRAVPDVLQLSSRFSPVVERLSKIGRLARYDNQSQTRAPDGSDGKVLLTALRMLLEWISNIAFSCSSLFTSDWLLVISRVLFNTRRHKARVKSS